jgi:hypothetical protein
MVEVVSSPPPGYKTIGPVETSGPGKAIDLFEPLKTEAKALALIKQHWLQHAEKPPKDFDGKHLAVRVVATVENTPQKGWGTLIVEFSYKPHGRATKK